MIEGQYQDYYKSYTSEELKYLPLNTILYSLPKPTPMMYWEWKHNRHSVDANEVRLIKLSYFFSFLLTSLLELK